MSQEQPPIRSRRELRQARDERLDTPGPGRADRGRNHRPEPPGSGRPGGLCACGPRPERSSQVRARDRAALRTIKELAEKEGHLAGGGPPTRRQLRLLQLATETAPATQANTDCPGQPADPGHPGGSPGRRHGPKDARADRMRPAAARAPRHPRIPQKTAPARAGQTPEGMTVEQALAARELLAEQARNQMAKMEHITATDPDAVDPAVLAEQIALAERAAVLNRRAAAKQKLAEQTASRRPPRNDPATANNLAMVTPLEFEKVPGVERPVMKRPATSYVPVVTNPGPRVDAPRKPGLPRPGLSRQTRLRVLRPAGPASWPARKQPPRPERRGRQVPRRSPRGRRTRLRWRGTRRREFRLRPGSPGRGHGRPGPGAAAAPAPARRPGPGGRRPHRRHHADRHRAGPLASSRLRPSAAATFSSSP